MSFSTAWRDYNTQRQRRYHLVPRLVKLARPYLAEHESLIWDLTESAERAEKLCEFGMALLGEQFDQEQQLSKKIRSLMIRCHHHHALILKDTYRDIEHDLLDAEAHMHALLSLVVGTKKKTGHL